MTGERTTATRKSTSFSNPYSSTSGSKCVRVGEPKRTHSKTLALWLTGLRWNARVPAGNRRCERCSVPVVRTTNPTRCVGARRGSRPLSKFQRASGALPATGHGPTAEFPLVNVNRLFARSRTGPRGGSRRSCRWTRRTRLVFRQDRSPVPPSSCSVTAEARNRPRMVMIE